MEPRPQRFNFCRIIPRSRARWRHSKWQRRNYAHLDGPLDIQCQRPRNTRRSASLQADRGGQRITRSLHSASAPHPRRPASRIGDHRQYRRLRNGDSVPRSRHRWQNGSRSGSRRTNPTHYNPRRQTRTISLSLLRAYVFRRDRRSIIIVSVHDASGERIWSVLYLCPVRRFVRLASAAGRQYA